MISVLPILTTNKAGYYLYLRQHSGPFQQVAPVAYSWIQQPGLISASAAQLCTAAHCISRMNGADRVCNIGDIPWYLLPLPAICYLLPPVPACCQPGRPGIGCGPDQSQSWQSWRSQGDRQAAGKLPNTGGK